MQTENYDLDITKCQCYTEVQVIYNTKLERKQIEHSCIPMKKPCFEIENCLFKELAKQLTEKEKELQKAMDNYVCLDLQRVKDYNKLAKMYNSKKEECDHLKTENEILEKDKANLDVIQETLKIQFNQLKTENEELKEKLEAVYDDCKGCPTCNEALYNANLYAKEYRKLKQTLAEIKEIAISAKDYFYDGLDVGVAHSKIDEIIQKISEVEE